MCVCVFVCGQMKHECYPHSPFSIHHRMHVLLIKSGVLIICVCDHLNPFHRVQRSFQSNQIPKIKSNPICIMSFCFPRGKTVLWHKCFPFHRNLAEYCFRCVRSNAVALFLKRIQSSHAANATQHQILGVFVN